MSVIGKTMMITPPFPEEKINNFKKIIESKDSNKLIVIYGELFYKNVFNQTYKSDYCFYMDPSKSTNFNIFSHGLSLYQKTT